MNYREWNTAIAGHFFNENKAGQKVFLHVDTELINSFGGSPDAVADFVNAILAGPDELSHSGTNYCRKGLRLRRSWRSTGASGFPPYIAYLAAFVLAASMEGAYQNEGYYKRLHRLLREEVTNVPPPHFYDAKDLWDDLKHWANEDNHGNLGTVRCEFVGHTPYVNLPRAQIVLSDQERSRLPLLFAEIEADPHAPPSAKEMLRLCLNHGTRRLEAKTMRRLRGQGDADLAVLTIEAILEELRYWDSTIEELGADSKELHYLRINLQIVDRLSGRGVSRFVAKDTEGWPDDGLTFVAGPSQTYLLKGFDGNWSHPLSDADGNPVDASASRWESGFSVTSGNTMLKLPARSVRVFKKGEFESLSGMVEVNRLDPYQEFYIAASASTQARLDAWGRAAATGWARVGLRAGLPSGWVLFKGDRANPDVTVPTDFPILNCDPSVRILLQGGLRVKPAGRRYFDFALPSIRFEGLTPSMTVAINGSNVAVDAGDSSHKISDPAPLGILKIDVLQNGEEKCTTSFESLDARSLPWREVSSKPLCSAGGSSIENGEGIPHACGAKVSNFTAPPIVLGLATECDLIGRHPGEVQSGLKDGPPQWVPVWLIEKGRGRRKVVFCGGDAAACGPKSQNGADRRAVRDWKKILWHDRRLLAGPTRGAASALWMAYRKAAENV